MRAIARHLGSPAALVDKVPTADLESMRPQLPDEAAYGVTCGEIDDFLEGKATSARALGIIEKFYMTSRHKRALPAHP